MCDNKDHNERFKDVFGAKNGCLACELETQRKIATRLRADRYRLREQLREFGWHKDGCDMASCPNMGDDDPCCECTCGWDSVREEVDNG